MVGVKIGEIISKASKALLGSNHNKTLNILGILAELYKNHGHMLILRIYLMKY